MTAIWSCNQNAGYSDTWNTFIKDTVTFWSLVECWGFKETLSRLPIPKMTSFANSLLNASELWVCISLFPNHLSPHPTSPVQSCFLHFCNLYEGYRKENGGDKCWVSFSEGLTFRTTSLESLFKNKTPKQTGLCLTSTKSLVSQEEENMATVLLSIRVKHHLNSSKVRDIT